jgi:bifunctional non-homologous end joining protein LigD
VAFQRKKPAAIGIKAPYPGFIEPALATSIDKMPSGERWIHEIKFDGYRVQVHLANNGVKVFTRRGNDWTKRFKKIADDAWHINAGPRSLTARSWCRLLMARRIFPCCRTNSRANRQRS